MGVMPNYKEKTCRICGKTFKPKNANQACCSWECQKINHDRMHKIWLENNKERISQRKKAKYKEKKGEKPVNLVIDFDSYDEYAERQKKESIEKYARVDL